MPRMGPEETWGLVPIGHSRNQRQASPDNLPLHTEDRETEKKNQISPSKVSLLFTSKFYPLLKEISILGYPGTARPKMEEILESQPLLRQISAPRAPTINDPSVEFDPNGDADNPQEWSNGYKNAILSLLAMMSFTVYVFTSISLITSLFTEVGGWGGLGGFFSSFQEELINQQATD